MTPRDFLSTYRPEAQHNLSHGACANASLAVGAGDVVGIVLLERGGPQHADEAESFLYRLLMDPAAVDIPVGGVLRHWLCRSLAWVHAGTLQEKYAMIGGSSPANRLVREQAHTLKTLLHRSQRPDGSGSPFHVYAALRHGTPSFEGTVQRMIDDGVTRVVLLPLHPHYSEATTGAMLAYWAALHDAGERPDWPTTTVCDYATHPKYIQALSERIDEGLQRFPSSKRCDVPIVFSTLGLPDVVPSALRSQAVPAGSRHDVQPTVDALLTSHPDRRPHHVAFEHHSRWSDGVAPALSKTLTSLAEAGHRSVLVVPLAFVTDHVETTCELDIEMREYATDLGFSRYEVASSLNSHPLFIEALAEVTGAHLQFSSDAAAPVSFEGDGTSDDRPLPSLSARSSSADCDTSDE